MPELFSPASFVDLVFGWGLFFTLSTLGCVAAGFAWERSAKGRRRRIFDVPLGAGQYRREAFANVRFVVLGTVIFPAAFAIGIVRADGTGVLAMGLTFVLCFAGFEAYYYLLHRALHTRVLVRFHRWHHESHVTTPLSGQSLGTLEAAAWILGLLVVPALLSRLSLLHGGAMVAYVLANAGGNIVGHANAEMMPSEAGLRSKSWLTHPYTYHALHHARWTGHFGLGTTVMDRLCGTEWPDWPALHARVLDEQPMRSLKDRAESK